MTAAGAVSLRDVVYDVRARRLLDGVSAEFAAGRFSVIVGPNGAGKSTLLRVATGLARPSAGAVAYGGRPLAAYAPLELARTRAVLSQHVELAFALTAAEVVLMGRAPHYARVPSARDRAVVDAALALVGMSGQRGQPYPTLSGGERQKVHLARVLAQLWADAPHETPGTAASGASGVAAGGAAGGAAGTPRVLFLDEPTASLDVHYQLAVLDLAREFAARGGAVVAVLHDLNVAMRYADDVLVMDAGRVAYRGADATAVPPALLERVFRVRARAVPDAEAGGVVWRFER